VACRVDDEVSDEAGGARIDDWQTYVTENRRQAHGLAADGHDGGMHADRSESLGDGREPSGSTVSPSMELVRSNDIVLAANLRGAVERHDAEISELWRAIERERDRSQKLAAAMVSEHERFANAVRAQVERRDAAAVHVRSFESEARKRLLVLWACLVLLMAGACTLFAVLILR
jgi:hypothetical protein